MALSVRVSTNFERNLESIRCFFQERGTPELFEDLLTYLFETVIPNLEHHPLMGRGLLEMPQGSVEAGVLVDRLRELLPPDASLRQYIAGDYLVLYLVADDRLTLLAIKHHLQLSFDLKGFYG